MSFLDPVADVLRGALQNQLVGGGLVLMITGALLALCRQLPARILFAARRQLMVSIDVMGSDPVFRWLSVWLDQHSYSRRSRHLSVSPAHRGGGMQVIFTPAPGIHWFWYRGRPVWLQRKRRELDSASIREGKAVAETFTIRVIGRRQEIVRALIADAHRLAVLDAERVTLHVASNGDWQSLREYTPRPLTSVILPGSLREEILADVREFLEAREWYGARGIPWRRGYLLHGLPGTGKTTLISALAGELKFNIYLVNLAGPGMSDEYLARLLLSVPSRAAVVFEDFDTVVQGRTVAASSPTGGVTFSGFLNVLDGMASRPGQMVWLTTNHAEQLDPALTRPGRVDRQIEFGPATMEQIVHMFRAFYGHDEALNPLAVKFAEQFAGSQAVLADVQQHLLLFKDNPRKAVGMSGRDFAA